MIEVLSYSETETGPTMRQALAARGIECHRVRGEKAIDPGHFTFTQHCYSIYSYVRPSNNETVYLLEVQIDLPPDAVLYNFWVLTEEPTDDDVCQIIGSKAQAGSRL